MSAFNFRVHPERIIVIADTRIARLERDGSYAHDGYTSKILPLPHLNSVLFGRGDPAVFFGALHDIMLAEADDVADLGDAAAQALQRSLDNQRGMFGAYTMDEDQEAMQGGLNAVLCGWSPRLRRMHGFMFEAAADGSVSTTLFSTIVSCAPDFGGQSQKLANLPATVASAVQMAGEQYRAVPPEAAVYGFGGPLTAVEITKTGMALTRHPAADDEQPNTSGGTLSRQQRRAMERQQRKAMT